MKLYYMTAACSLASNIALREAGLKFELVKVDRHSKRAADGLDYLTVNPKGYVPALTLDEGATLTENVAILSWIADHTQAAPLAPPAGSLGRYQLLEWLGFINSELHKGFSPLFNKEATEEVRQYALAHLVKRLGQLQGLLGKRPYLQGDAFTVADAYLFVVLSWGQYVKVELARWPELERYYESIRTRPHVLEALKSEHLLK
ncbi:MAG: glutathione transferase GstA [Gammaproteobacteria bacterium]|nr:glutathione transferase GstA [Gammaproteobacteria bacterium]